VRQPIQLAADRQLAGLVLFTGRFLMEWAEVRSLRCATSMPGLGPVDTFARQAGKRRRFSAQHAGYQGIDRTAEIEEIWK
jgi:hypothetical protein